MKQQLLVLLFLLSFFFLINSTSTPPTSLLHSKLLDLGTQEISFHSHSSQATRIIPHPSAPLLNIKNQILLLSKFTQQLHTQQFIISFHTYLPISRIKVQMIIINLYHLTLVIPFPVVHLFLGVLLALKR